MLKQLIADLQQLDQQLGDVSDIKEKIARAKADLDSINQTKEQADVRLKESQNLLTKAQADAQRQFEQDMFNKQGMLKSLTERIEAAQKKLTEVTAELDEKESRMRATNNALTEAKKTLAAW
jgi:chromosome segregation ATPase